MLRFSLISLCLFAYRLIRKTGILNLPAVHAIFLKTYFFYKSRVEDSLALLLRHHPEWLAHGDVIDVGAHVGYTASVLRRYLPQQTRSRIHAFEPDPSNFRDLQSLVLQNNWSDQILIHPAAVGSHEGQAQLWINPDHPADHRVIQSPDQIGHSVPLISLDRYCETHQIDQVSFLKIDVQGFELEVLRGAEKILNTNPDLKIYFEFDPKNLKEMGTDPVELLQFLKTKQFKLLQFDPSHRWTPFEYQPDHWSPGSYLDLVALKSF